MNSFFGLSDNYKENVAKILRGTTKQLGCAIQSLKFDSNEKTTKQEKVASFLKTINSFFTGIMRFEEANGRIIPMVYNKTLLDTQQAAFSNDAIAMAFLILLLYSDSKVPVPLDELIERLMVIKKEKKDVTGPLKELKDNLLIEESKEGGYITYIPTDVLFAILPQAILIQIRDEIENSDEYKENFSAFFSAEYIRKRGQIKHESSMIKEENRLESEGPAKSEDNGPQDNKTEGENQ